MLSHLLGTLLCCCLFQALPQIALANPGADQFRIVVQNEDPGQPVNRKLLGQNIMYAGNGMWDARIDGLEPEAAQLIDPLQPPVLRFPGGSLSNLYLWEDGLGILTDAPVSPQTRELTLPPGHSWQGVNQIRLIDRCNGKYGDLASVTDCRDGFLTGLHGFSHVHPAGANLRVERRLGQPGWHSNSYGILEHLKLCAVFQAQPLLTVNASTGLSANGQVSTAVSLSQRLKRAAAWVAFLNGSPDDARPLGRDEEGHDWGTVGHWAGRRVARGYAQPLGVTHWEIGNELFDRHETGFAAIKQYAQLVVSFSQAMKAVDPTIKIGAVGVADPQGKGDADPDLPWNVHLLETAGSHVDFLAVHLYYPSAGPHPVPYHSRAWFGAVMGAASQARQHLRGVRALLDASAKGQERQLNLVVSEYGVWPAASQSGRDFSNLARALYEADLLLGLFQEHGNLGVEMATAWNLHGNNPTAALSFSFANESRQPRPHYYVYRLLQAHLGASIVPVRVTAPTCSVPLVGNVTLGDLIPALQVLATRTQRNSLNLLVVNRSLDHDLTGTIVFQDGQPRSPVRLYILQGPSPGAHNEGPVCQVEIQRRQPAGGSGPCRYTFSRHSLTVMEF